MDNYETIKAVLLEFIECVESDGGFIRVTEPYPSIYNPVRDEDCLNLYIKACQALGRIPMVE